MRLISSILNSIRNPSLNLIKKKPVPAHVAIIMDGNRRWAAIKKLPKIIGHRKGVGALRNIVKAGRELGIKYLTVYSFSSENWQRSQNEVNDLMNLFLEALENEIDSLHKNGVRLKLIGDRKSIPKNILKKFENAENITRNNVKLNLNIAFNYGSRKEILEALNKMFSSIQKDELKLKELDGNIFSKYLYTSNIPDPDLLIRTSGERRISNFLLWQLAYTELYFTEILWPDFDRKQFFKAIYSFQQRDRRFGKR